MTINKFYRAPIVAACLLLIVTGLVFKTIKVKAANQCFPSCDVFHSYEFSLCPSGSVWVNGYCGGGGWNVLCGKQVPYGTDPARCITGSECFNTTFLCMCYEDGQCGTCASEVCKAVFGSCGPYGGVGQQPYMYAGTGGAIMETCGQ